MSRMLASLILGLAVLAGSAQADGGDLPDGAGVFRTSDGVELAYTIDGKGAPTLFLHGGPGSGSASFRKLAGARVGKSYRMIWLDQRGSGSSQGAPDRNYSLDRQLQDLEELRAHLALERWNVMAYSFGGVIAQAYAQSRPTRVRSLVLVNALLDLGASMQTTVDNGLPLLPEAQRPRFGDDVPLPNRFFAVSAMLQKSGAGWRLQTSSEEIWAEASAANAGGNKQMAQAIFERGPGRYVEDFTASTAAFDEPVLVVAGDRDLVVGDQRTRFAYPRKTEVVLRGGHMAFHEDADAFARAIGEFARKTR